MTTPLTLQAAKRGSAESCGSVTEVSSLLVSGTHGSDCYKWGPSHFECAQREIERLRVALERALAIVPDIEIRK